MFALRCGLILGLGAMSSVMAGDGVGVQPAFRTVKPIPAPPSKLPPLPPAVIDNQLAIGGQNINARKLRSRMTVEVLVNRRGPYRFLVDSGADSSVVGQRIARDLQLRAGTPAILNSMTASARVERVLVDELSFGPSTIRNLEVPALLEQNLGADGIVGIDALGEQRLMMDFEKRVIKVEDARRPAKRVGDEIVVTARRQRGQLILTRVRAAGFAVDAVVDTGAELTIGNLALRDKLLRRNRDQFTTVAAVGVTGVTINLQVARISELRLGTVIVRNVPMAFADVPPFAVFGLDDQPALLLGSDVLETFRRVSLDFRARKVRFQLRRCGSNGVALNTPGSSIVLLASGENPEVCRR